MKSGVWLINDKDEKKIVVTHINVRVSIVFLLLKLIALDILATVGVLFFFGVLSIEQLPHETWWFIFSNNVGFFITLATVKILLTLFVVLQWLNEYYEITPTSILYRRGILWRRDDTYNLAKVNALGIQQGIFGKIFNYGTIFFYDVGVFKYYNLNYIHNPLRYLNILHSILPDVDIEKEVVREHVRDVEAE